MSTVPEPSVRGSWWRWALASVIAANLASLASFAIGIMNQSSVNFALPLSLVLAPVLWSATSIVTSLAFIPLAAILRHVSSRIPRAIGALVAVLPLAAAVIDWDDVVISGTRLAFVIPLAGVAYALLGDRAETGSQGVADVDRLLRASAFGVVLGIASGGFSLLLLAVSEAIALTSGGSTRNGATFMDPEGIFLMAFARSPVLLFASALTPVAAVAASRRNLLVRSTIFLVAAAGVVGFSMLGAIEPVPVASALLTALVMVPALAIGARVQAQFDGAASRGSDDD